MVQNIFEEQSKIPKNVTSQREVCVAFSGACLLKIVLFSLALYSYKDGQMIRNDQLEGVT